MFIRQLAVVALLATSTNGMSFPTQALLPKAETKAQLFVENNPKYDGRDVTIGILDTGVDPGAIGLSKLPDGSRKLVHVADCTGSGDVAMDTETFAVKEERGWVIEKDVFGEKEIVLNPDFCLKPFPVTAEAKNDATTEGEEKKEKGDDKAKTGDDEESGKGDSDDGKIRMPVRLGFKRLYELFPKKLTARVKRHYAREFEQDRHNHAVDIHRQLAEFAEKYDKKQPTQEQLREKEDLLAKLEVLEGKFPDFDPLGEDPGPLCQLILFHDGKDYRVLVDTNQGDLSSLPLSEAMTDFYKEGQYGTFSNIDMCNYAVNIYQDGKVASIVVDAGAHGSHVAGITARHHEESGNNDEEPNGVAPGAKLISLKIGDTRLGSMETGAALTRALIEAVKHKCDVINLSYGEGCAFPNNGRFARLAEDLVYKHGIVFVSSAGNNGPALTTVGAPGGTTSAILGIGAYVSPAMMEAKYNAPKDENEGTTFTWSSVGPTADGDQGVDLMAPGGAITCVPNWCLQRNQLMNGTSMSSPNAAGCIALILSAAKAEGIQLTPARLKQALINCAENTNNLSCLQQGWGMINVEKTWEYLKEHKDDPFADINFKVRVTGRPGQARGVYLRQPEETLVKQTFSALINPVFGTQDDADAELQKKRIEFEMKVTLEATASWIEIPEFFMLMHNGRSFKFVVDPTKLEPGVHTAKILGYDVNKKELGPRFSVPITVVKTMEQSSSISLGKLEFETNEVKRFFLDVPDGATWMDVTVKDCREQNVDKETSARLMVLHTVQLLPHNAYRDAETQKYLNLLPAEETVTSIPVHPKVTCELDLARYWSAQGSTKMQVGVEFRGVTATPDDLTIISGGNGVKTRLFSGLRNQDIKPEAKLTKWRTPLSPVKSIISPCDERDILPTNNKQIHQLVSTYEFEQKEAGSFVLRAPALQGYIYESAFESQIMLVFDENKRYLGVADSWPDEVKAPEGKVTVRMQVRHDDVKKLELLKETIVWVERKLSSGINLSTYGSHAAMVTNGVTMKKQTLRKGSTVAAFFKEPPTSKLPSESKCGDILSGTATFEDNSSTLPGEGHNPDGSSIRFIVGSKVESDKKKDKAKTPELPDERSVEEKIEEEIRSVKVDQLKKMMDKDEDVEKTEEFYDQLLVEYSDHIPLMIAALQYYDKKEKRGDNLEKVKEVADLIVSKIDEKEVAAHFGMDYDKEDPKSCKERKDFEDKKSYLVEALARKAHAEVGGDKFEASLQHLAKWEDIEKNKKYAILSLEKHKRAKRYGLMLKLLNSLLEKKGNETKDGIFQLSKDDIIKERAMVLKSLNYTKLSERDQSWSRISAALKDYALF